jgi:hypothetical protein
MQLFLFHLSRELTLACRQAGMDAMILDLESRGKDRRQERYDTQISTHTLDDLEWLRRNYTGHIICRINGSNNLDEHEIRAALALGADELLLPMVKTVEEVVRVRDLVPPPARLGIMLETCEALHIVDQLARCDISRAYVGLNDLAISGGYKNIFQPMADGTVERLKAFFNVPFGVAGLTHPALGSPIPSILLLAEMKRLGISFSFLRRSFYRDLAKFEAARIVTDLRSQWSTPGLASQHRRETLKAAIHGLEKGGYPGHPASGS